MRVRPELNNKLRSTVESDNPSQVVSSSFKQAMTESGRAPAAPVKGSTYRPKHQSHQPVAVKTRTVQAKTITTEQAKNIAKHAGIINECSRKYGVPKELICAVILQESSGKVKARSQVGAMGLMQLMPQTAKRFGVVNAYDARQNIEGGTKYLRFLLEKFKGDYRLALAGYNAGEHRVEQYKGIPPFAETQNYVPSVLSYADTIWNMLHKPQQFAVSSANLPSHARKV